MTYRDVLHIYGVARASYVPQLFSLRLPNPDIIYQLLHKTGAVFLIYDESFETIVMNSPIPRHTAREIRSDEVEGETLPPLAAEELRPDDIIMIFHTSGSTSGSPKLVPCTLRWVDSAVAKSHKVTRPIRPGQQDVTTWL
jgi:acyl-coenzyme A synthetase/AMP-(fatty) acid ligase